MEAEQETTAMAVHQPIAWETKDGEFLDRVWRTIKQVLLQPKETFASPSTKGNGPALGFAITMLLFGVIVGGLWELVLHNHSWNASDYGLIGSLFAMFIALFFIVILVIPSLFLTASITHFFLWTFSASKGGFAATFRVLCYCSATAVLAALPYAGMLASAIYGSIILVVGLASAHRTSWVRVLLSVLTSSIIWLLLSGYMYLQGMSE